MNNADFSQILSVIHLFSWISYSNTSASSEQQKLIYILTI